MICSMTPPILNYGKEWDDFVEREQDPTQAICSHCGIRHDRAGRPYCDKIQRWFSWIDQKKADARRA